MLGDETQQMGPSDRELAVTLSVERTRPPTTVPGYTARRFLGQGAYGEVWVARDNNTGREVAIKFFAQRGGLDWSLLTREVEKLRFLFNSRHCVQLLEVGWDARPPYYVMEYFANGSLEEKLREGPLPVETALEIFREITDALVHAHSKGVLHCDLKPGNVLLDDDSRPRLADFGQARLLDDPTPALGTLFFMAPEQADAVAAPDARWDVYALGAIFYRMVTGIAPFDAEEFHARLTELREVSSRLDLYRRHVRAAAKPKAHRSVAGMDRELADIIDRCLETNPQKRFPNPQAVLGALENRRLARARRPLLILGGVGPLILLAVLLIVGYSGFMTTVSSSRETLLARANEGNRFAARFVAKSVAGEFEQRFNALELAGLDLATPLAAAAADLSSTSLREALQARLEAVHRESDKTLPATSWFIADVAGNQLARSPEFTEVRNYAWRDYFHGQGHDLPPGETRPAPISRRHVSLTFESQTTKTRMVAFSAPVWNASAPDGERRVLGVLAMTVEVGRFGVLKPDEGAAQEEQVKNAVLVDTREDRSGKRGLILQHPTLTAQRESQSDVNLPDVYYPQEIVDRMLRIREQVHRGEPITASNALIYGLADPLGTPDSGLWDLAIEPVILHNVSAKEGDTGLMVVVEDQERAVTSPIRVLERRLILRGALAVLLFVVVVAGIWGFVIVVLSGSSRSRFATLLRRQAGLPTSEMGTRRSGATDSPTDTGRRLTGTPRDTSKEGIDA